MKKENSSKVNNKILKNTLSVVIAVVVIALSFAGGYFTNYLFRGKNVGVVSDIVSLMDRVGYIYDPVTGVEREITKEDIGDAIVNAFLDDYSAYYTKEEYERKVSQDAGNYWGIGVQFYFTDTQVDVVVGNSPADHAGLIAGDILVSGKSAGQEGKTFFSTATDVINFLVSCPVGSDIEICYLRDGKECVTTVKTRPYVASYVNYYDSEVRYSFFADGIEKPVGKQTTNDALKIDSDDVAYIRLDAFEGDASKQMKDV